MLHFSLPKYYYNDGNYDENDPIYDEDYSDMDQELLLSSNSDMDTMEYEDLHTTDSYEVYKSYIDEIINSITNIFENTYGKEFTNDSLSLSDISCTDAGTVSAEFTLTHGKTNTHLTFTTDDITTFDNATYDVDNFMFKVDNCYNVPVNTPNGEE